ncbi:MAG TPA: ABC transporter permease, partial [Actinomycetota bacterium]|nr:ABC transporter permease [Actinomycetota bacterium]
IGSMIQVQFAVTFTHFFPWTLRVVGIGATPGEFPPQQIGTNGGGSAEPIHVTPALYRSLVTDRPSNQRVFTFTLLLLRLKPGATAATTLNDDLNRLANGKAQPSQSLDPQSANVQRSIHLQAVALWIVAALVALIACLIFSQLLARQATLDATESPTLLALGMTRWQVWLAGISRMATIGIAGAAIGVLAAYLSSTLMPIGVARNAEPNTGLSFDVLVLGVAATGVIVIVLSLSAWPVWRSTRTIERPRAHSERPSLVARTATAPGLTAPASTGLRLALEPGHGPTVVPVRSSLFSVVLAIVALTGALSFGASLDHLLSTPRLYGWNWDIHITTNNANDDTQALKMLLPDGRIQDIAEADGPPVVLDDKAHLDLLGLYQRKGLIQPIIVDGRMAETPDEIVLGVKTIKDLHAHIGSTVTMYISAIKAIPAQYKVVGTAVIPPNSDSSRLGEGVITIRAGTLRMAPPGFQIPPPADLYINFAPGVNKSAAEADLTKEFGQQYSVLLPQRPTDLVNFGQVQNLPLLLAGLVGLLAVATLAHTLATSIRRRRRDFAILKMLGFVPAQVRSTVAWQATTFVSTALLIGIPVGIGVGRVVWTAFANQLGTVPEPITPSVSLLLAIASGIVLANVIAAIPAVVAGRMRPAPALRAE